MRTSDRGIAFLVAHEGVVPAPYWDSASPPVLTYGIGHTAAAGAPIPASMARGMPADLDAALREAFAVFRRDLVKYESAVAKALTGIDVGQHEFDAAVSFHFNTGAIASADWVRKWRAGDKAGAAAAMMNWKKPASIIPRRQAERSLFSKGTYGNQQAAVWPVDAAGRITWKPVRTLTQSQILALLGRESRPTEKPIPASPAAPGFIGIALVIAAAAAFFLTR